MALVKLVKDGEYGQLELNFAAFRRVGAIEATCKMHKDITHLENGMLVRVDRANRVCGFDGTVNGPIALNYTTEHMYDEREGALKNFKLDNGTFLPRLGYLGTADKFTTNTVVYNTEDFADLDAVKEALKTGRVYGKATETGYIQLTKTADEAAVEVIKVTDMPDGQDAIQFAGM